MRYYGEFLMYKVRVLLCDVYLSPIDSIGHKMGVFCARIGNGNWPLYHLLMLSTLAVQVMWSGMQMTV